MITAMADAMTELASFELLSLECRTGSNGTLRYYNAQGQEHRVYGPAVEYSDGSYEWRIMAYCTDLMAQQLKARMSIGSGAKTDDDTGLMGQLLNGQTAVSFGILTEYGLLKLRGTDK